MRTFVFPTPQLQVKAIVFNAHVVELETRFNWTGEGTPRRGSNSNDSVRGRIIVIQTQKLCKKYVCCVLSADSKL